MYNVLRLQTPRGSGTNGYIQSNKFFVKPRWIPVHADAVPSRSRTEIAARNPNKDIVEHDRKRQIHPKLLILQDTLADQGYTKTEISERLEKAIRRLRRKLPLLSRMAAVVTIVLPFRASDSRVSRI